MDRKYFASADPDTLATELWSKVTNYYEEVERNQRLALWRRAYRAYFGLNDREQHQGLKIRSGGEQGELSTMKANHYRNLLMHLHVLATQQRPSFECRAVNTDYKSQIQTILGTNLLEYYLREKHFEDHYRLAMEYLLNYGEAYTEVGWDKKRGEEYGGDIDTGEIIKTGDVFMRVYAPHDVIRGARSDADTKQNWYILRRWENRFDLAARFPDHAEKVMQHAADYDQEELSAFFRKYTDEDDDMIPVFQFYHERTDACPDGREAVFLGSDCLLQNSELSMAELPVYKAMAYSQHGTSFGYTVAFDLLVVQEAIDNLYSTVLSNQLTFGVQNIWMKPGANITESALGGGLNIIEAAEKPEALNLTHTPPEIFNFLKGLESLGEMLSGVNSVARGQPEASLKSGAALALVASQAVQFSNGIQASYVRMLEDTGSAVIKTLQKRATLPRTAAIVGKNNRSYMKEFSAADISSISRVFVDVGNPVTRTVAGRIELANSLLQGQAIKRPEQYIQVITTGRLDPVIDAEQQENLQIQLENEELRQGNPVQAVAVDMHIQHIKDHKAIFADPEARKDPKVLGAALDHIQEHIMLLKTTDPSLLNALGQAPIAPDVPPQGANAPQPPMNQPQDPNQSEQAPAPQGMPPDQAAMLPTIPQAV